MITDKAVKDLLRRVQKLEDVVFGTHETKTARQDFKGATGGLRLLVSNGFFDRKRIFSEIETELRNHKYHYSKQAIQTPLNRLSATGGPLVALRDKGRKAYAKRK